MVSLRGRLLLFSNLTYFVGVSGRQRILLNNILAYYDWEPVLFLKVVRLCIDRCIPTKSDFVTPLVKSLLQKRRKLRRKGKTTEADELAVKINGLICELM